MCDILDGRSSHGLMILYLSLSMADPEFWKRGS